VATRAGAFVALGTLDHTVGDIAAAETHHREALRLYLEAGDAFGAALAQNFLAYQLRESGQIEAFRANNEQARILAESSGNTRALLSYHWLSAFADCDSGNLDGCLTHIETIRQIHLTTGGDPLPEDWVSHQLMTGAALYFAGRLEEARAVLDGHVADIRMRGGHVTWVGAVWSYTGRTYLALGQVDVAETFFREGLEEAVFSELSDLIIWHLEGLASVAVRRGQWRPAARLFGAAAAMRETFHFVLEPAEAPRRECELAALRAALGDDGAEVALAEGRAMSREAAVDLALRADRGA
jgi:tetratricopeptide (TPR) repeat protein